VIKIIHFEYMIGQPE